MLSVPVMRACKTMNILTMVGTSGQLTYGVILLGFYSMGLALPMLLVAYSSHLLQNRIKALARHDKIFRYVSGGILVAFGLYLFRSGRKFRVLVSYKSFSAFFR